MMSLSLFGHYIQILDPLTFQIYWFRQLFILMQGLVSIGGYLYASVFLLAAFGFIFDLLSGYGFALFQCLYGISYVVLHTCQHLQTSLRLSNSVIVHQVSRGEVNVIIWENH